MSGAIEVNIDYGPRDIEIESLDKLDPRSPVPDYRLIGALRSDSHGVFPYYRLVSKEQAEEFSGDFAASRKFIPGTTRRAIGQLLRKNHTSFEDPRLTYVVEDLHPGLRSGKYWEGWYITHLPTVVGIVSISTLRDISRQHGSVLISSDALPVGGEKGLTDAGFTTSYYGRFIQVRYNPRAITNRPHNARMRKYKRRLRTYFDPHIYHSLCGLFSPDNWPKRHPFHGVAVDSKNLDYCAGWGSKWKGLHQYTIDDHLLLKEMTWKLWKVKYWREVRSSYHCKYRNLEDIIEAAWENIHAVEDHGQGIYDNVLKAAAVDYQGHLMSSYFGRSSHRQPVVVTEKSKYLSKYGSDTKKLLDFCKWLRTEARALKIKPPKRPVRPITELQAERLAAKKKAEAARRRKLKLKEAKRAQSGRTK